MYKYKSIESQDDGSHFFVKTPSGCLIRISLYKPDEDYKNEYLEENIRHLIVKKCNDFIMTYIETKEMCETISHIVYDFMAFMGQIVKVEVTNTSNTNSHVKRFLKTRPKAIKGFVKENIDGHDLYFLYNSNILDGTDLLSSLIDEYET